MTSTVELRGITWDHDRGYLPMARSCDLYAEIRPDVEIRWERRSLQDFGDGPLEELVRRFDMIVVDHPFAGLIARDRLLIPLEGLVPEAHLADLATNTVGPSYASYQYAGSLWALPLDAAGHVSAARPDLLERLGAECPATWEQVLALSEKSGHADGAVAFPGIPLDSMMAFCSIAASLGAPPMVDEMAVVPRDVGREALGLLAALAAVAHPGSAAWNPPALLERMSSTSEIAYCPLTFGYSNYSRPEYRQHLVTFGEVPRFGDEPGHGVLGGAGFAISPGCEHPEEAAAYGQWITAAEQQRSFYFDAGGQPAHRAAWVDERVNAASGDYFSATLPSLDRAYLRPRYCGYMEFQEVAGGLIRGHALDPRHPGADATLASLDRLYRASRGTSRAQGRL